MTFKSLISPLAVAAVLALGSALPSSAAIFGGNVAIQFKPSRPIDQSSLTPAERTQLEDQCRQRQSESSTSSIAATTTIAEHRFAPTPRTAQSHRAAPRSCKRPASAGRIVHTIRCRRTSGRSRSAAGPECRISPRSMM